MATDSDADLQKEIEALKTDLAQIRDDLGGLTDSLVGRGKDTVTHLRKSGEERVDKSIQSVEQYVREQPLTTLLVSFGVGLLTGLVFTRK